MQLLARGRHQEFFSIALVVTTEHAGPHLDEFGLVEMTVMVSVEHVDEVERHGPVEAHQLL